MAKMRILITEYVMSSYEAYTMYDLLPEAITMVRFLGYTLINNGADVSITINPSMGSLISNFVPLHRGVFIKIDPRNYFNEISLLSQNFNYVLVIAPPKQLIEVTSLIDRGKLLQPPHELIRLFSDKYYTVKELERCGIYVPKTLLITDINEFNNINISNKRLIIKPTLLAGSECIYVIDKGDSNVKGILKHVISCDPSKKAVVQEFIEGAHGSISVIFGINGPLFYSVNLQLISQINNKLNFFGGILPIKDKRIIKTAKDTINRLFRCYPELRGYVGLDFVWNENGMYIVEINPRPTTSIAGIIMLYPNLGKYLLNIYDKNNKNNMVFLGDLVDKYAYYLLTERHKLSMVYDKDIVVIDPPGTNKVMLLGISSDLLYIYDKIKSLGNLIYDLNELSI